MQSNLLLCAYWTVISLDEINSPTFLVPGGAGSKILVCISLGRAEYTGSIISSGTSGPRDFILSYKISHEVSISSCPALIIKSTKVHVEEHMSVLLAFICKMQ